MADVFDTLTETKPADIFDAVGMAAPKSTGDVFDQVAPAETLSAGAPKTLGQHIRESLAPLIGETTNQTAERIGGDGQTPIDLGEMFTRYGVPRTLLKVASTMTMGAPGTLAQGGAQNIVRAIAGQPMEQIVRPGIDTGAGPATKLSELGPKVATAPDAGLPEQIAGAVGHGLGTLPGFVAGAEALGPALQFPEAVRVAAAKNALVRLLTRAGGAGIVGGAAAAAEGGGAGDIAKGAAATAPLGPLGAIANPAARAAAFGTYGAALPVAEGLAHGKSAKDITPEAAGGAVFNSLLALMTGGGVSPFSEKFAIPIIETNPETGAPVIDAKTGKPATKPYTGADLSNDLQAELVKRGVKADDAAATVAQMGRFVEQGLPDHAQAEYLKALRKPAASGDVFDQLGAGAPDQAPTFKADLPGITAAMKKLGAGAAADQGGTGGAGSTPNPAGPVPALPPQPGPSVATPATAAPVKPVKLADFAGEITPAVAASQAPAPDSLSKAQQIAYYRQQQRLQGALGSFTAQIQRGEFDQSTLDAVKLHAEQLAAVGKTAAPAGSEVEPTQRYSVQTQGNLAYLRDQQDDRPVAVKAKTDQRGMSDLRDHAKDLNTADAFDLASQSHFLEPQEQAQFDQPVSMKEKETGRSFLNTTRTAIVGRNNELIAQARQRALDFLNVAPDSPDREAINRDTRTAIKLRASYAGVLTRKLKEEETQRKQDAAVEEWKKIRTENAGQGLEMADWPPAALERLDELEKQIPKGVLDQIKEPAAALRPPTPETTAQLQGQLENLKAGHVPAVAFTEGEDASHFPVPAGFEKTDVQVVEPNRAPYKATVYFDPQKLTPAQIVDAAANNRMGDVLDYGIASKPANPIGVVRVHDKDGTPVREVLTDEQSAPAVTAKAQELADAIGGKVGTTSAEQAVTERKQPAPAAPTLATVNQKLDALHTKLDALAKGEPPPEDNTVQKTSIPPAVQTSAPASLAALAKVPTAGAQSVDGEQVSDAIKPGFPIAPDPAETRVQLEGRVDALAPGGDHQQLPTQTVKLANLTATNDYLKRSSVAKAISQPREAYMPVVAKADGQEFIVDGHHRLEARRLQGEESATVRYADLDATQKTQAAAGTAAAAAGSAQGMPLPTSAGIQPLAGTQDFEGKSNRSQASPPPPVSTVRMMKPSQLTGPVHTAPTTNFRVGDVDSISQRKILQSSDNRNQNLAKAESVKPILDTVLRDVAAAVPGAVAQPARVKGKTRLDFKIDDKGYPSQTVGDYLGARINFDHPTDVAAIIGGLQHHGNVVDVQDFLEQQHAQLGAPRTGAPYDRAPSRITGADNAAYADVRRQAGQALGLGPAAVAKLADPAERAQRLADLQKLQPTPTGSVDELAQALRTHGLKRPGGRLPVSAGEADKLARVVNAFADAHDVRLGDVVRAVRSGAPTDAQAIGGIGSEKGATTFPVDGQTLGAVVHLFRGADASTAVHEFFHAFFPHLSSEHVGTLAQEFQSDIHGMDQTGAVPAWARGLVPDRAALRDATAQLDPADLTPHQTRLMQEWGARRFERYLHDGQTEVGPLRAVFEKVSQWLRQIYGAVKGTSLDGDLSPATRRVFEEMLGGAAVSPESTARSAGRLTLESPTAAELNAEQTRAAQRQALADGQSKPLKGGAIDTTGDLLDATKADNPLFAAKSPDRNALFQPDGKRDEELPPVPPEWVGKRLRDVSRDLPRDPAQPRLLDVGRSNAEISLAAGAEFQKWQPTMKAADKSAVLLHNPEGGSLGARVRHLIFDNEGRRLDASKAEWLPMVPDTLANAQLRLVDAVSGNRLYARQYADGTKHLVVVAPDGTVREQMPFEGSLISQFPDLPPSRHGQMVIDWVRGETGFGRSQGNPAPTPAGSTSPGSRQPEFQGKGTPSTGDVKSAAPDGALFQRGEEKPGAEESVNKSAGKGWARKLTDDAQDFLAVDATPKMRRVDPDLAVKAREMAYAPAAVDRMVNDTLAKIFPTSYKNPEAMARTMQVLNADRILGDYDRRLETARKLAAQGQNLEAANYRGLAEQIAQAHDLVELQKLVNAAKQDPAIMADIERWKKHYGSKQNTSEPDKWYGELKQVDTWSKQTGTGRNFGARINLFPIKKEVGDAALAARVKAGDVKFTPGGSAARVNKDPFARLAEATGTYSDDARGVLENMYRSRWPAVTKLRFYNALEKSGAMVVERPDPKTGRFEPPTQIQGQVPAKMEITLPETDRETGIVRNVAHSVWVRSDLLEETRRALRTDLDSPMHPIAQLLNQVQLAQIADPIAHAKNQHTLIANLPALAADWQTVLRKMPVLGSGYAVKQVHDVMREITADTPAIRQELSGMARAGLLRQPSQAGGISGLLKTHDFLQNTDTATRVIMNRFFTKAVETGIAKDTPDNRARFVAQVGEYNTRLMGDLTARAKQSGFSPFIVAGRAFNQAGRRLLTGNPGFEATSPGAAAQVRGLNILTGVVGAAAIPMMLNLVTTGSVGGRPGTPLGAWDLGRDEKDGKHTVADLLQLTGLRRGLRATGANALVEGLRAGKSANTIGGDMLSDVSRSFTHPYLGPAVGFVARAGFGVNPDMRGGPQPTTARNVGGGIAQYLEQGRVALQNQNPLVYSLLAPAVGDTSQSYGKGVGDAAWKAPASALGIQQLRSPAQLLAYDRLRALRPVGGLTTAQADRGQLRNEIIDLFPTDPEAARQKFSAALTAGKLTSQDAKTIGEELAGGSSPLLRAAKRLQAQDPASLQEVYQIASPDEQKLLHPMMAQHELMSQAKALRQQYGIKDVRRSAVVKATVAATGQSQADVNAAYDQWQMNQPAHTGPANEMAQAIVTGEPPRTLADRLEQQGITGDAAKERWLKSVELMGRRVAVDNDDLRVAISRALRDTNVDAETRRANVQVLLREAALQHYQALAGKAARTPTVAELKQQLNMAR